MSTATPLRQPSPSTPESDPYYYGFRDDCITLPDGTEQWERVALTLEDHLHPHFGDHFMEGELHQLLCNYLADVFRDRLAKDRTAVVLSNSGVFWDDPRLRHHAPDIAVIFGLPEKRDYLESFNVAEHGVRPSLILELVSPRFRKNDVEKKFRQYHQAGVPLFVILDRVRADDPWEIRGYQRTSTRYLPIPLDERGRLYLPPVDLWLAVDGQKILCYEDQSDEPLGNYTAINERLKRTKELADAAAARADAEKARADTEKARADTEKAQAEIERARADAEKAQTEIERARADTANARAEAEKTRADAAEARIRELERRLQQNQ